MVMVKHHQNYGFTLIELLVVMAIIATLLSLTMPRYFHSVDKSKEAALRADLNGMRDAIDKYFGDHAKYPDTLDDLVVKKYLRNIPPDPLTGSNLTWIPIPPDDSEKGKVYDVRSGAQGAAGDGTLYGEW
jgi:general secretion pathway protein G